MNPSGSCCQSKSCKKTRMVFKPSDCAQPSSCVDALGIESIRLPHFKFVDGRGWNVVAADEPRLLCVPIVRSLLQSNGMSALAKTVRIPE